MITNENNIIKKMLTVRKSITVMLILSLVSSLSVGSVYAYDSPVSHIEVKNSVNWNYTGVPGTDKIAAAASLGYFGATWTPGYNKWNFVFRLGGTASSRNSLDYTSNRIGIATMIIKNTVNPSSLVLDYITDTNTIGSAPEASGSLPAYYDVAYAVVNYATLHLTTLQSYIYTTGSLINSLRSTYDGNTSNSSTLIRSWDWSTNISDTGQFFWFFAFVPAHSSTQFSAEYAVLGNGYELLSAGKLYYTLTTGAAGSASKSAATLDKDWNPGMMTPEEKAEFGIIEIPRDEIDKQASKLNIAPSVVKILKDSDDEVFYHATKFSVTASTSPTNEKLSPKESLIQDINEKLVRSETIINEFSQAENKGEEQQRIIEKHKNFTGILQNLLERVEHADENDIKELGEIRLSLSNLK